MERNEVKMEYSKPEQQIINELRWWTLNMPQVIEREKSSKWSKQWWVVYRHNCNERWTILRNNGKI